MKLFSLAFSCGIGILCVVWTAITLARGEFLTAIVVFGFAVSCVGLAATLIRVRLGRVAPRGTFDAAGTTIRPDRGVEVLAQTMSLAAVVSMGLFAIFAPVGKLDIPMPAARHFYLVYLPFVAAAGAVTGALIMWRAYRRGGPTSYLRLTPEGFEFTEGLWSSVGHGGWGEVNEVTDRQPDSRPPPRSAIVMVMSDGQNHTLPTADAYTRGGEALRQMVRFYWQHPEDRAELTDGRALARLSSNDFKAD